MSGAGSAPGGALGPRCQGRRGKPCADGSSGRRGSAAPASRSAGAPSRLALSHCPPNETRDTRSATAFRTAMESIALEAIRAGTAWVPPSTSRSSQSPLRVRFVPARALRKESVRARERGVRGGPRSSLDRGRGRCRADLGRCARSRASASRPPPRRTRAPPPATAARHVGARPPSDGRSVSLSSCSQPRCWECLPVWIGCTFRPSSTMVSPRAARRVLHRDRVQRRVARWRRELAR